MRRRSRLVVTLPLDTVRLPRPSNASGTLLRSSPPYSTLAPSSQSQGEENAIRANLHKSDIIAILISRSPFCAGCSLRASNQAPHVTQRRELYHITHEQRNTKALQSTGQNRNRPALGRKITSYRSWQYRDIFVPVLTRRILSNETCRHQATRPRIVPHSVLNRWVPTDSNFNLSLVLPSPLPHGTRERAFYKAFPGCPREARPFN